MAGKRAYRILWIVALGAIVGGVFATWLAPKIIAWYWQPPVSMGVDCRSPIEWSLRRLEIFQLVGLGGGGLLALILALMSGRKKAALEET